MNEVPAKYLAPLGAVWVCAACGKQSKDRRGDAGTRWDASCFLNAVLCVESSYRKDAEGNVTADPWPNE